MCETCVEAGSVSRFVYDVIEAFLSRYPEEEFGGGHIVLADCNVGDEHIEWCLTDTVCSPDVQPFLRWLLTVPEAERCPVPYE